MTKNSRGVELETQFSGRFPSREFFSERRRRIAIVGTTGSGKTTLARQIAQQLRIPHVELDAIFWDSDWTQVPQELFRERTAQALKREAWVVDGNYSKVRDIVWSKAEVIVWLDYPLPLMMWRLVKRTYKRVITGEELWSGNRETIRKALLSTDSILLWQLKTYRKLRKIYPALLNAPEHAHLAVVHLRSPSKTQQWVQLGLELYDSEGGGSAM